MSLETINSFSELPSPLNKDEWFYAMIENSPFLIMRNREDATITYVNKAVCKLFNILPENIVGKKWLTDLNDTQKKMLLNNLAQSKKDLTSFKNIVPYILEGGTRKIIEWITSPIYDNHDRFVGEYQGIGIDITDKVATEDELQKKEDQLEIFFGQSLDGFFFMQGEEPIKLDDSVDKKEVIDKLLNTQHIIKANKAFLDQYRATESEILGLTPADFFTHEPSLELISALKF